MREYGKIGSWEWARDEAQRMLARAQLPGTSRVATLHESCQAVLDGVRGRAGTWRSYEEHFVTLCAFFGSETPLALITRERIEAFVAHRRAQVHRGKPVGELRIRKNLAALNAVFLDATRRDQFAGANPVKKVRLPPVRPKEAGHYGADELPALFEDLAKYASSTQAYRRTALHAAVLLFAGLRREELAKLQVRQADQAAGWLRGIEGKRNVASVPITAPLAAALTALGEGLGPDDHFVPAGVAHGPRKKDKAPRSDTERRCDGLNRTFVEARAHLRESLRARFRPHTLRHSLRTLLADAEVPLHVRNAITRHADHSMGGRYEHTSPAAVRAWACKVLDPLLPLVERLLAGGAAAAQA